jgi:TrpR-related protein YerC/YecD
VGSSDKLIDEQTTMLFHAVLSLRTVDECYRFFEDLCTVAEISSLAQRFKVARMLDQGLTYSEISRLTGASSATISRVKRFLHYGADGYRIVLDRMRHQGESPSRTMPPDTSEPGS